MEDKEIDPEVQSVIDSELAILDQKHQEILERVSQINPIHEDLIIVQKVDTKSLGTFLHLPDVAEFDRMRLSYYGIVLKVSENDSGDEVKELKKKQIKIGDVVSFNPDAAYSLNIIVPKDMPEIWCLSIENILIVDKGFDVIEAKKKTVHCRVIFERTKKMVLQNKMEQDLRKAKQAGVIS